MTATSPILVGAVLLVGLGIASPACSADANYLPQSMTPVPPKHLVKKEEGETAQSYDVAYNSMVGNRRNRAASLDPYTTTSLDPVPSSQYMPQIMMAEASGKAKTSKATDDAPLLPGAGQRSRDFNPVKAPGYHSAGVSEKDYDWSGVYAGAKAGAALGLAKYEKATINSFGTQRLSSSSDGTSFGFGSAAGGVFVGANVPVQAFIIGLEGGIIQTNIENSHEARTGVKRTVTFDTLITTRARLGVPYGQSLFFATFGAGFGTPRYLLDETVQDVTTRTRETGKSAAWMMGAGVDYAFTDNIFGRFEYSFADFGNLEKSTRTTEFGFLNVQNSISHKFNMHLIEFAIAFKY